MGVIIMKKKLIIYLIIFSAIFLFLMQGCVLENKPVVNITSPANNDTITYKILTVTGTIEDRDGDASEVQVWIEGTDISGVDYIDTSDEFSVDLDLTGLTSGTYKICAQGFDENDNTSDKVSVSFTYNPGSGPTVTITSPTNNTRITANKLTVQGTINDVDGDASKVEVWIKENTIFYEWDYDVTSGQFSVDMSLIYLSYGTYTICAQGYDQNGNVSDIITVSITYNISGSKPTVTITSPTNNTTITTKTLTVQGTINDVDGDASKVEVWIKENTSFYYSDYDVTSGQFSVNLSLTYLASGAYTICAQGYDKNYNTSDIVYVSFNYINGSKPTVTITSPTNNAKITIKTLTVQGTINDVDGDADKVKVWIDGKDISGWDNYIVSDQFSVDLDLTGLTSGTYKICAQGYDDKNNISDTVTVNFTYYEPVVNHDSTWLVLVYLDGDNNLEESAIDDLNEMENALYKQFDNPNRNQLNILVLFDRAYGYDSSNGDWKSTRLYYVQPDSSNTSTIYSTLLEDYGELNMGDPNTLSNFISYAKQNFTYQHLMLILWNHGGGARYKSDVSTISNISKDICEDDTDSDILYLDEVQQAISANFNSANKLDIIGFDACLMGTVEVAYEFRDLASYMIGSMHTEQGDGWDYESLFYGGTTNCPQLDPSSITAADMAIRAVKSYRDFIEATYSNSGETMAAIDLSKLPALKTKIDQLAVSIYSENKKSNIETIRDSSIHFYDSDDDSISIPYFDLYDLCNRIYNDATYGFSAGLKNAANDVITALSDAILYAYGDDGNGQSYYFGDGVATKRGLSIFFSRGNLTDYENDSHYAYQWWYTSEDTNTWNSGFYYGKIDFADSDTDGIVETWRELFEAWYDPTNSYTPGSY